MSRETIRTLQEHRKTHVDAIATIDATLALLVAAPGKSRGGKRTAPVLTEAQRAERSEAAKEMWAKRRAAEAAAKAGKKAPTGKATPTQKKLAKLGTAVAQKQAGAGASLAEAAEG